MDKAVGCNPAFCGFDSHPVLSSEQAFVVELVYTLVLETNAFGIEGSTPSERTMKHTIDCWEKQPIRGCTCKAQETDMKKSNHDPETCEIEDCFKCKIQSIGIGMVPGGTKDFRMKTPKGDRG